VMIRLPCSEMVRSWVDTNYNTAFNAYFAGSRSCVRSEEVVVLAVSFYFAISNDCRPMDTESTFETR
jgi:hypothetical protein